MQKIIGFTLIIVWVLGYLFIMMRRADKKRKKSFDSFLADEREANNARRKEIDPSLYYNADVTDIPLLRDGSKQEERVLKFASRPMIRFKEHLTNTELKKAYGPSQLENITLYEENYNGYISALIELAEYRIEMNLETDAARILEYTLELGSQYRKSYCLAADIYVKKRDVSKLNKLLEKAESREFLDEGTKRFVVRTLMDKRDELDIGDEAK